MARGLVLVDIQQGFDAPGWGPRNNPGAEANAARLLAHARAAGWGIVHVRHVPVQPGSPLSGPGTAFKPEVAPLPGETVVEKSVNSAFIGTGLEALLRGAGIGELVICGLTTPHCVSTTARMAANLGFAVRLAHDACAAFAANADTGRSGAPRPTAAAIHAAALDQVHGEFATVQPTDAILALG